MNKVVLLLAYRGTHYAGWQKQPNHLSVQTVLEQSLQKITGTLVPVASSGRTDSGVHAYGQVAHFPQPAHASFEHESRIKRTLNATLPHDIVVRDVAITSCPTFHSRFSAIAKEYRYTLSKQIKPLPWHYGFCYPPKRPFHVDLMKEGTRYLLGTHDFASFANHGREYTSTVRTLYTFAIEEDDQGLVTIICKGNGFLYKMVRNLVGALLDVGQGKYPPEHLDHILQQKNRRSGPAAAPSYALSLHHVCYPEPYRWFCNCNNDANDEKVKIFLPDKSE